MIGFLRGDILDVTDNRILLLVGGVGYQVTLSQGPESAALVSGSKLEVHVHTHVREDALDLYGFITRVEKELFLLLLTVNGIGPKGALAVLSGMSPASLVEAILGGDHGKLQKIPGVGKKTAERLVLELSDALKKRPDLIAVSPAAGGSSLRGGVRAAATNSFSVLGKAFSDAQEALVQLGFREADVVSVLKRMESESSPELKSPEPQEIVRRALQQLR
ncbi:MAG: Holliday junction branch migration protein RuvA [Bdellovibrionales bacterium]|nr:Holliday junction branch migration protein RuvA [Bdellovibrionales bacterium]